MSDFLDRLGAELDRAARRRARHAYVPFAPPWSRRALVMAIALLALVAVPTGAALTGVFNGSSGHPNPRTSPSLVDVGPHCTGPTPKPQFTDDPPAPELLRILGVLRRPATPEDAIEHPESASQMLGGPVNPNAIRLAQTTPDGTRYYLIPVANVNAQHPLPDTPACKRFRSPKLPVLPGVYLREKTRDGGGGATRATVDAIERGFTLFTSYVEGRDGPGHAIAAGIAPDGVSAVTLRHRTHGRTHSITVPVVGNVFATSFAGHAGANIRLYFHTADGLKAVGRKPPSLAVRRRQQALNRRSKARDRAATAKAEAFPPSGSAHTIFTVRMKAPRPPAHAIYVVRVAGPQPGACSKQSSNRIGVEPALAGELRGLVKASFGFPRNVPGWCRGHYRGTITLDANGRRKGGDRGVVGRFGFVVR